MCDRVFPGLEVCETVWGPAWDAEEERESTMVFIGKQADKQKLTDRFLASTRVPIRADASVVWRAVPRNRCILH